MQLNEDQLLDEDQKKEVEKRIHRSACFKRVFERDVEGKEVLKEIDIMSNYNIDTFDPDPYISAYRAGRRSVSVFIHNTISQDLDKAKEMLKNAGSQT